MHLLCSNHAYMEMVYTYLYSNETHDWLQNVNITTQGNKQLFTEIAVARDECGCYCTTVKPWKPIHFRGLHNKTYWREEFPFPTYVFYYVFTPLQTTYEKRTCHECCAVLVQAWLLKTYLRNEIFTTHAHHSHTYPITVNSVRVQMKVTDLESNLRWTIHIKQLFQKHAHIDQSWNGEVNLW